MPIDRSHAFADDPCYPRPRGRWPRLHWPWTAEARACQAWSQYQRGAVLRKGCLLGPNAWCVNSLGRPELIELREQVVCRGLLRIEKFGQGRILVGAKAYIGDDTLLSSSVGIEIGSGTLIAHGVQIFDNDSHPIEAGARSDHYFGVPGASDSIASAPVRIGEQVWIGFNAIILKGVTIGRESVVAAGSVVTRDVPAGSLVAGNPARVIKQLRTDHAGIPGLETGAREPLPRD